MPDASPETPLEAPERADQIPNGTGGPPQVRVGIQPLSDGDVLVVEDQRPQRPDRKIALVGYTASKEEAPWADQTFEKWLCNDLYRFVPDNWQRLYDLHDTADIRKNPEHDSFLRGQPSKRPHDGSMVSGIGNRPVYVWDPQPEWPTAVRFPKEAVTRAFGRYFTNSISWMIAHAILENATELHVYGVDMAQGTEYAAQRPSCEYFLGFAAGLGVKIHIPAQSDLLKNLSLYGAEDDTPFRAKLISREKELSDRLGQLQGQHAQITAQINQMNGALEDVRYWKGVWLNAHASRDGQVQEEVPSG